MPFIVFEGPDGAGKTTALRFVREALAREGYDVLATKEPTADRPFGKLVRDMYMEVKSSQEAAQALLGEGLVEVFLDAHASTRSTSSLPALFQRACQLQNLAREVVSHALDLEDVRVQLMIQLGMIFDRADHLQDCILPNLLDDRIVLCDRYCLSTLAYATGGEDGWLDLWRAHVEIIGRNFRWPDLTILFDVNPRVGLGRVRSARGTGDSFEQIKKQERIRTAYQRDLRKFFWGGATPRFFPESLFCIDTTTLPEEQGCRYALEAIKTFLARRSPGG